MTGVTSMRMVEKLDAGAILLKCELPIGLGDTVTDLHDRLSEMTAEALCETVRGLSRGEIPDQVQDESLVTYASKLSKEMEFLDGSALDASALDRRVRALNPWPGTSVWVKTGEKSIRLKIKRAQWSRAVSAEPGSITEVHGVEGLYLGAKAGGSLRLESVQWDGRKEVDIAEFRNGLRGMGLTLPLRTGPC